MIPITLNMQKTKDKREQTIKKGLLLLLINKNSKPYIVTLIGLNFLIWDIVLIYNKIIVKFIYSKIYNRSN